MNIILSVKPKWAKLIYSGKKTIEWRKTAPRAFVNRTFQKKEKPVKVYLYETAPVKRITGFFILGLIHRLGNPRRWPFDIWKVSLDDFVKRGFVPLDDLKEYAGETSGIYAWDIGNIYKFHEIYKLEDLGLKRPPQSWCYTSFNITTLRAYFDAKEEKKG